MLALCAGPTADVATDMAMPAQIAAVKEAMKEEDGGLSDLFHVSLLHADIVKQLGSEGVETLSDFASYFTADGYETECTTVRDNVDELKGRQIEVARLRTAVQIATAALKEEPKETKGDKKKDKEDADLEAPLPEEDKKSMLTNWNKSYGITLTMWFDPCDSLVNRLFREFRANTPSLLAAERIRAVIQAATPQPENKQRVPGTTLCVYSSEVPDEIVANSWQYFCAFRVLANASAKAGNDDVAWTTGDKKGETVKYAPRREH